MQNVSLERNICPGYKQLACELEVENFQQLQTVTHQTLFADCSSQGLSLNFRQSSYHWACQKDLAKEYDLSPKLRPPSKDLEFSITLIRMC